jgi:hypothetical protein
MYRQIQQLHLTAIYRDDESARSTARKLMSLPLIPLSDIEAAFDVIADGAPDSMRPLIEYFNRYWMTKVNWSLWNVSDFDLRTNNVVEGEYFLPCHPQLDPGLCAGWNHRFNRLVAKFHPNVWHLFECLKREEVTIRQQMLKMLTGVRKTVPKKTLSHQVRIDTLRSQFDQRTIGLDEFLEGLSLLVGAKP